MNREWENSVIRCRSVMSNIEEDVGVPEQVMSPELRREYCKLKRRQYEKARQIYERLCALGDVLSDL